MWWLLLEQGCSGCMCGCWVCLQQGLQRLIRKREKVLLELFALSSDTSSQFHGVFILRPPCSECYATIPGHCDQFSSTISCTRTENVKLEKRRFYSTVRHLEGNVVTQLSSACCFLSHHPFVAVLPAEIFFCLAQKHRDMTFTHWSRASLLQVHCLIGFMIENVGILDLVFLFFSPSVTLWHSLQNPCSDDNCRKNPHNWLMALCLWCIGACPEKDVLCKAFEAKTM